MYGWYAKKGNIKVKVDIESLIQPYIHNYFNIMKMLYFQCQTKRNLTPDTF